MAREARREMRLVQARFPHWDWNARGGGGGGEREQYGHADAGEGTVCPWRHTPVGPGRAELTALFWRNKLDTLAHNNSSPVYNAGGPYIN